MIVSSSVSVGWPIVSCRYTTVFRIWRSCCRLTAACILLLSETWSQEFDVKKRDDQDLKSVLVIGNTTMNYEHDLLDYR